MKKLVVIIGLLIGPMLSLLAQQNDAAAKKLLDQVSQKYDGYQTIIANFQFKAAQAEGETYQDAGTLRMEKKSNKYRIKLKEQEIISDGTSVWSILPEDKEVQITEADNSANAIGPSNLFTFYKNGFKYVSANNESDGGETLDVVEMTPIDQNSNYFKIKLRVNKNKHIHDVTVFDKGGNRYTYSITALYVNSTIQPGNFAFSKGNYPGFEVVDLR